MLGILKIIMFQFGKWMPTIHSFLPRGNYVLARQGANYEVYLKRGRIYLDLVITNLEF